MAKPKTYQLTGNKKRWRNQWWAHRRNIYSGRFFRAARDIRLAVFNYETKAFDPIEIAGGYGR